jgi:hypothetical protein
MHRMMIRRRSGPGAATLSLLRASHTFLFLAPLAPCGADPAPVIKPKLVIAPSAIGGSLLMRPRVMPEPAACATM